MNHDDIQFFDQRLAMVRMTIRAMREVHTVICDTRFGKEPDMIMIGLVIIEGMAKARPRSKSAISRMTGISRATLGRRLAELERDGHIAREGKGLCGFGAQAQLTRAIEAGARLIDAFIQVGRELSNLDNNQ